MCSVDDLLDDFIEDLSIAKVKLYSSDNLCRRGREIEILRWLHNYGSRWYERCQQQHGDANIHPRSCSWYFEIINDLDMTHYAYFGVELDLSTLTSPF